MMAITKRNVALAAIIECRTRAQEGIIRRHLTINDGRCMMNAADLMEEILGELTAAEERAMRYKRERDGRARALRREGMHMAFDVVYREVISLLDQRDALSDSDLVGAAGLTLKNKSDAAISILKSISDAMKSLEGET